jgi:hypothetical protein
MNQKTLLIAVVAVVAIGIVVGVWLSGADRTGPLAGSIVPEQTGGCQGSQLDAKYHPAPLRTTVWGTLRNLDGTPIPDQSLTIYQCGGGACDFFVDYPVKTDASGRFQVTKSTGGSTALDIEVSFRYGVSNGRPYCPNTAKAAYSMTGP